LELARGNPSVSLESKKKGEGVGVKTRGRAKLDFQWKNVKAKNSHGEKIGATGGREQKRKGESMRPVVGGKE